MNTVDSNPSRVPPEVMRRSVDRVTYFSDAVYAIAITLLALEIHLPTGIDLQSQQAVSAALVADSSQFVAFALSFLIIGLFWMSHVRKYRALARHDARFMKLNLVVLMLVGLMPFTTNLMSSSETKIATQLYAGILTLLGIMSALLWSYALRQGFINPLPSRQLRRAELAQPLLITAVFGISIAIAGVNADMAKWFWLILAPIGWFLR
jgi:uncharacterized membrane protein